MVRKEDSVTEKPHFTRLAFKTHEMSRKLRSRFLYGRSRRGYGNGGRSAPRGSLSCSAKHFAPCIRFAEKRFCFFCSEAKLQPGTENYGLLHCKASMFRHYTLFLHGLLNTLNALRCNRKLLAILRFLCRCRSIVGTDVAREVSMPSAVERFLHRFRDAL